MLLNAVCAQNCAARFHPAAHARQIARRRHAQLLKPRVRQRRRATAEMARVERALGEGAAARIASSRL